MPEDNGNSEEVTPPGESADVLDMVERLLQHARDQRQRLNRVGDTANTALTLGYRNSERLDALEDRLRGQHGDNEIVSALKFAAMEGLATDGRSVNRIGKIGAAFARSISVKPVRLPHPHWPDGVNGFPVWLWRLAISKPKSAAS